MTIQIGLLFLLIAFMIYMMVTERVSIDTLSLIIMTVLIVSGFVTPEEGLAGFSNQATITILALMILTGGLEQTGVITTMARTLKKLLVGQEWMIITVIMIIVAMFSAVISTTAVVIVFMRILVKLTKEIPANLSRLLMPLSFAGIMGGACTLIGTSTNLLVNSIAVESNIEGFGVFEFAKIGGIFFGAGLLYMIVIGIWLIPKRKKDKSGLVKEYDLEGYFTELMVSEGTDLTDKKIKDIDFFKGEEIDLIEIRRGSNLIFPRASNSLKAGDIILVKSNVEKLAQLRNQYNLLPTDQNSMDDERLKSSEMTLCEVIVKHNSKMVGKRLNKKSFKREYDAIPLALKKSVKYFRFGLNNLKIEAGDTILVEVSKNNFEEFYNRPGLVVIAGHEDLANNSNKKLLALGIMAGVILIAALNILPILESALIGVIAMTVTKCLELRATYKKIEWNVIIMIAGIIPLGTAMQNTGASDLIAQLFTDTLSNVSPRIMVGGLYLGTTLLSSVISNNATAILFAPIAISVGTQLNIDPRPLLLTVMFAANMSFMSPVGYQTNTLIYNVGDYKFKDFTLVGGMLSLLIWILAIWLIPEFYF